MMTFSIRTKREKTRREKAKDIDGQRSLFLVVSHMANKTNSGSKESATNRAFVIDLSSIREWICLSCLSHLSFRHSLLHSLSFPWLISTFGSCSPFPSVCGKSLPVCFLNGAVLHCASKSIFVSLFWSSLIPTACWQFRVQNALWESWVWHTYHMPCPA